MKKKSFIKYWISEMKGTEMLRLASKILQEVSNEDHFI